MTSRLIAILLLLLPVHQARSENIYYLLDNSASMYDGYPQPKSGPQSYYYRRPVFQAFLKELIELTCKPNDTISIITFNRVTNVVQSPIKASQLRIDLLLPPYGKLDVIGATSPEDIKSTRMPDALEQLLAELGGRQALIWLLTDNIADSGASQEAEDTRKFYSLLANNKQIQMVYAYPIKHEGINNLSSLMLYAIVAATEKPLEVEELTRWEEEYISTKQLEKFMQGKPFQMKPLERNTLRLKLRDELRLDAVDENSPLSGTVEIVISSRFNYHVITSAKLELVASDLQPERDSISKISGSDFSFSPQQPYKIKSLKPRSEETFVVTFTTPQVSINPSRNNYSTLFKDIFDEEFSMQGTLTARVKDVQLQLELPDKMKGIFGTADIPEIFRPQAVDMEELHLELKPKVRNTGTRLLLVLLLAGILSTTMISMVVWLVKPRYYYVSFDDSFEFYKLYSLRRNQAATIKSDSGEIWKTMP